MINKVTLVGRLGQDVELKHTTNGTPVANFSVATGKKWKDKSGEMKESTEWHRIVAWKALAENCHKYLSKGKQVYLEGELQTRMWEDKEGKKNYTTEVVARDVKFLDSVGGGEKKESAPAPEYTDDQIPF